MHGVWQGGLVALSALLVLAGCRSTPLAEPRRRGSVDVAIVVPPPGAARIELASDQGFAFPDLILPAAMPEYPEELLSARLEPFELCMEIDIAASGEVFDARRRIDDACPMDAGGHEPRFADAMGAAVLQWRYVPARICALPDGRTVADVCGEPDAVQTPVSLRLSYVFGFSQFEGVPSVEMAEAQ